MVDTKRLKELAVRGLEAERSRIEQEIKELTLESAGMGVGRTPGPKGAGTTPAAKRARRGMSAARRKAHSEKMTAYWAKKKAAAKPARKKPRFTAAQRKAAAARMKAYWAKKKKSPLKKEQSPAA